MNEFPFKKGVVKIFFIFILICSYKISSSQSSSVNFLSKSDTAFVPKEIEDHENIGINKEASHATLMPYASLKEALTAMLLPLAAV